MTQPDQDPGQLPLANWKRCGWPLVLVGHRGAAGLAPENTLPSFDLAHALGVDAIELDVHLSRDGIPVVIHDETVDRTTNGHGRVADLTVAELTALDAGTLSGTASTIARIPTLAAVLAWARGRCRVVIELKGTEDVRLARRTIDVIRKFAMDDHVLLISFDHGAIGEIHPIAGLIPRGVLYAKPMDDPIAMAFAVGATVICPHWSLATHEVISAAHAAQLAVSVWTANDDRAVRSSLAARVDAVTSDYPDVARAIASPGR